MGVGRTLNSIKIHTLSYRLTLYFTDTFNSLITERPLLKPWYQVNLEEFVEVHAILIYRQASKSTVLIECALIINVLE